METKLIINVRIFNQKRSLRIRLVNWIFLINIITLFVWFALRLVYMKMRANKLLLLH